MFEEGKSSFGCAYRVFFSNNHGKEEERDEPNFLAQWAEMVNEHTTREPFFRHIALWTRCSPYFHRTRCPSSAPSTGSPGTPGWAEAGAASSSSPWSWESPSSSPSSRCTSSCATSTRSASPTLCCGPRPARCSTRTSPYAIPTTSAGRGWKVRKSLWVFRLHMKTCCCSS